MQSQQNIIDTYDKVAEKYAGHYINELDEKPFDTLLLRSFADVNKHKGTLLDIGCGPGQTTAFLAANGCTAILGTDLSPAMIANAKEINPALNFELADMLKLQYADKAFSAAVAFYAIVNLDYPQIQTAFSEISRVLIDEGQFLFSFHTGDEVVHLNELLDEKVEIDFYFLNEDKIITMLSEAGFKVITAATRYPYSHEFQSRRAYILAQKD